MTGGMALMLAVLLFSLLGSICESAVSWVLRFVHPIELLAALIFIAVLIIFIGPIMEAAETGLATIDWLNGGMR